ncbi:hypothetical protein Tco_0403656 [Tanacetum coccineum]
MSEGLKHGIEHGKADRDLATIEAYDPEADSKYVKALQDLKDLKYPLVDQLEGLKDAHMELIMSSLHLESDSGEDAPQWICDLRPNSSQLQIHVHPKVPRDPWAFKEDMLLEDVIAANISQAGKKRSAWAGDSVGGYRHTDRANVLGTQQARIQNPWPLGLQPSYTSSNY